MGEWRFVHGEHIHLGFPAMSRQEVAGGCLDRKWSRCCLDRKWSECCLDRKWCLAVYQRESSTAYFFY